MEKTKIDKSTLVNVVAIVLSVLACVISLYEANIMSAQQKALVWPHLRLDDNFNANGYSVVASNNGVGPCIINSMEVVYHGKPIDSYNNLLSQLNKNQVIGYENIKINKLNNTVLKNGEERLLFQIALNDSTQHIVNELRKLNYKI